MYEQSSNQIFPTAAIMRETKEQPNMFIRSFETNSSGHAINSILDATDNGKNLSPILLSPVAGSFLNLSPNVSNGANIAGGWHTKRFRFVLNFKTQPTMNGDYFSFYATGYTDIFDMSFGNNISPDTKLFFNNIISHRHSIERDPYTGIPHEKETRSSEIQIVSKNSVSGTVNFIENGMDAASHMGGVNTYLRPMDVMKLATSSMDSFDLLGVNYPTVQGNACQPVVMTNRNNNNPVNYLGKTIRSLREASIDTIENGGEIHNLGYGMGDLERDYTRNAMNVAMKTLNEPDRGSNYLTTILFGFPNFCTYGFMFWRDLVGMWPMLDRQLDIKLSPTLKETGMNPLDSDNWSGAGFEHMLATSMITHLPTLMIERSIGKIGFSVTNRFVYHGLVDFDPVIFQYTDSAMISNAMVPDLTLEQLKNRIIQEIVFPLTAQGQMDFKIDCHINLIGNSFITVSLNGGIDRHFSAPQFADNIYTPLLSGNGFKLNELASDFISLVGNMNNNLGVTRQGVHNPALTQHGLQHHLAPNQVGSIPQPQFVSAGFY